MTSDDLLSICSKLAEDSTWAKFCREFDDAGCLAKRLETRHIIEGHETALFVQRLQSLCFRLELHESYRDGWEFGLPDFGTKDAQAEDLAKSAFALAQSVRSMFSSSQLGQSRRQMLLDEVESRERRAALPEHRMRRTGHDALLALIEFVDRESRLPSKKELNIEAGRRNRAEIRSLKLCLCHGDRIPESDFWWKVQSCKERLKHSGYIQEMLGESVTERYFETALVRCTSNGNEWERGRWSEKEFGQDILAPFGLSGLPKHRKR